MDWDDLQLSRETLAKVRGGFALDSPEQVVSLAWGAEDLLGRVLSPDEVATIKRCHPRPRAAFDSSRFSRGARLGTPPAIPNVDLDFVVKRDALVNQLGEETSPEQRAALERRLKDLYSRGG